jgi:hypothetical protein
MSTHFDWLLAAIRSFNNWHHNFKLGNYIGIFLKQKNFFRFISLFFLFFFQPFIGIFSTPKPESRVELVIRAIYRSVLAITYTLAGKHLDLFDINLMRR